MAHEGVDFQQLAAANATRVKALRELVRPQSSEQKELAIRSAIERFVAGTTKTDGSWTVVNLVIESSVPRPTLYRYEATLKDFHLLSEAAPRGSGGLREELQRLRADLRTARRERIEERKRFEQVQAILVQRVHALSIALAEAAGQSKVVSLLKGDL